MTSMTESREDVAAYLTAVRAHLADLPELEREDLLAEVSASVVEAAAEGGIEDRLGSAGRFAEELRSAAGLAPAEPRVSLRELLVRVLPRLRPLRELAPIWWAARGYVAVTALGFAFGWTLIHPAIPRFLNSSSAPRIGVLAIAAGVAVSAALGLWLRRSRTAWRRSAWALDVAVLALVVPVALHLTRAHVIVTQQYVTYVAPPVGLIYNGAVLHNIYPYSRDGKLLHDVLLYDELGRPVAINRDDADANRRVLHTAGKYVPIYNSFPIRYFDPGTHTVAHPNAGPRVHVARLAPGP